MSEHFVGFPPFGQTCNYAHGGKGPFRSSYQTLTKLVSLHQKSHQDLSLLNFKCAARISTPGGPLYIIRWGCAQRISKTTAIKLLMSNTKKVSIQKQKKLKNPKKLKTPLPMCSRGLSQIIKIVLVMFTSGILLSKKHPKTYQYGLWQSI